MTAALAARVGVLLTLATGAGAGSAADSPVFPKSTAGVTIASRVAPAEYGRIAHYAIAPDRQSVVLFERIAATGAPVAWQLRVLDANGKTLRDRRLRAGYDPTQPDIYFSDRGELLIDDSNFFYVVDVVTLRTEQTPQCRKHAYPGREAHAAEAEAQVRGERAAELARLARAHGVRDADIESDDLKSLPAPLVDARRRWAQTSAETVARRIEERYLAMVERFASSTTDMVGIQVERPMLTSYYVRVNADGKLWYCDLEARAQKYAVRWSRRADAAGVTPMSMTQADLRREGDVVRDGAASIQVLKATRTTPWNCSWQVGCADRFDYRLRLSGLPGATMPVEVLTRDTGLARSRGGGGAFRLANGNWLLEHDGLYLFTAPAAAERKP